MDIGKVLTRAWEIIWKHKILWVFGFFASFISQPGSSSFEGSGGGGGGTGYQFDGEEIPFLPPAYQRYVYEFNQFVLENSETIFTVGLILIAIGVLLGIFFYLLGNLGRIGLFDTLDVIISSTVRQTIWQGYSSSYCPNRS